MREENREVLAARFPGVLTRLDAAPAPGRLEVSRDTPAPLVRIDGIQLASAYDPRGEAALQARLVPEDAERATIYGVAHGDLPRVLLERPALRRLLVVVLAPAAARASLATLAHADWLADPRVELTLPDGRKELEPPFAAAPACLRLADEAGARLRDLVVLELGTPHARRRLTEAGEVIARRLEASRALLATDGDAAALFDSAPGGTVRVAAAGPTLADHLDRLRAADAPLIAVDAALRPLVEAGVVPDVVVSVDAHDEGMRRVFDVRSEGLAAATLVYFPSVPRPVLEAWPGRRLAAYDASPRYARLRAELPRAVLFASGSVAHPAVDLAVRIGAARVELFGCDFATPRGRSHVPGCAWEWGEAPSGARTWVTDGHGGRVPSVPNLVGYLRDLERWIARHSGVRFVNASRDGARIAGTVYEEASHAA